MTQVPKKPRGLDSNPKTTVSAEDGTTFETTEGSAGPNRSFVVAALSSSPGAGSGAGRLGCKKSAAAVGMDAIVPRWRRRVIQD